MLLFYYWMACWAAGTYISSGLVVPMLLIGALYGRMLGKFMVDIFGVPETAYWDWLDPGKEVRMTHRSTKETLKQFSHLGTQLGSLEH